MDVASDHTLSDPRLTVGDSQQTPPGPAQVQDEMQKPEIEVHQKDPFTQEPENSADQECGADEIGMLRDKPTGIATKPDKKPSSGEESRTGQKEQLMVKLKYRTSTKTTATSSSPIVKQETGDHRDTSSPNSKPSDQQIKIEKNGDDQVLIPKPLNEPREALSQASIVKDEPDRDVHHQIDHPVQDPVRDEMDVDAHLGDDAVHVPVSNNILNKPSDVTGAQAAALESEKVQKCVAFEERRVDNVNGDYQQSENASPEAAHGGDRALDDHDGSDYMSDEIDLNEWTSSVVNEENQGYRAIDHQLTSSGFTIDELNVQQQDQVERLSQTFDTGQSGVGVQDAWSRSHPDFPDPVHFTHKSSSPHFQNSRISTPTVTLEDFTQHQTPPPLHVSQQPFDQRIQANFGPGFGRQQQLQTQIEEQRKQLENLRKLNEERSQPFQQSPYEFGYPRSQSNAPPPYLFGPLTYERAPQFSNQQVSNGFGSTGFQQPTLPTVSYDQMPPNMSYSFNPASLYKRTTKAQAPPNSGDWMPGPYVSQGPQKARKKLLVKNDCRDEGDASDDDEPLRSRVKRHPSVTSSRDSVIGMSPLPIASNGIAQHSRQDDYSDVEFVASTSKPKHAAPKVGQNQVRMSHPASQPTLSSPPPPENASPSLENAGEIDWTLPQYEVQRQPLAKGEEIPSAKVSLPGLVREELLLSPDHADEEVHLLMNIFIPNQRALPNPDPEPAIALLNFHTMAVMVIEAYVQYEIGDEFGTGRGHFHTEHNRGDAEYERMRDAVDADTNEIFFAVVDRYRAGLESKKKPLQLIRGTQEFCDLALDLIFHIKDHGLLRPEPKARAVRVDKGVKRGPRGGVIKAEETKGKAIKRGTIAKPNEVQPRKKAKTAAAAVEVKRKKKRAKPKTLGVTVVKR